MKKMKVVYGGGLREGSRWWWFTGIDGVVSYNVELVKTQVRVQKNGVEGIPRI